MAAAACDLCGASTPGDARFCPRCGTRLDLEVVDLSTAEPNEVTGNHDERSGRPRVAPMIVAAVVVLGVALGGLWLLSDDGGESEDAIVPPPPLAPEEPATSETLASVVSVRAAPARVDELLDPDQRSSIGLVGADDTLIWLTGQVAGGAWGAAGGGHTAVEVRRTEDGGRTWSVLAHDLPSDALLATVALVDGRVVAAGTDGDGRLSIWRSTDGQSWTGEQLSEDDRRGPTIRTPTAIIDGPTGLIVLARDTPDVSVLEPLIPGGSADVGVALTTFGGESRLVYWVPFGLRIDGPTVRSDELTPAMRAVFEELTGPRRQATPEGSLWVQTDVGWDSTLIEGQPFGGAVLADGTPLVIGAGNGGSIEWTLDDTGGWRARPARSYLFELATWNDATIATGPDDLRIRQDDGAWERYGLSETLDATAMFFGSVHADDAVVAVSVSIADDEPASTVAPGQLTKDGWVLTYTPSESAVVVAAPSGGTVTIAPWQPSLPEEVTLDIERGLLVVRDPSGEADEVAFTLSELGALERATVGAVGRGGRAEVLMSTDGWTWSRGSVEGASLITDLTRVEGGVVAVAGTWGPPGSGALTRNVRLVRISES